VNFAAACTVQVKLMTNDVITSTVYIFAVNSK